LPADSFFGALFAAGFFGALSVMPEAFGLVFVVTAFFLTRAGFFENF
jgi:hypothetical protein